MTAAAPAPQGGLKYWVERLSEREMPVLGHTVQSLCAISGDDETSASDLATAVLRDAAMTSGVLKIANSAYYNSGNSQINTVSRAVVLLGFQAVRSIGLSIAVIDQIMHPGARQRVIDLMRQGVYAAVQAKTIAQHCKDPQPEQAFIGALLSRLGEMAFWSFAEESEVAALRGMDKLAPAEAQKLQQQLLGCTLPQLTVGLAKAWGLGEPLVEVLQAPPDTKDGRAATVQLGHALEAAVREHGWNSAKVAEIVGKVAEHVGVQPERAKQIIANSKRELHKAAEAFGMHLELETGAKSSAREEAPTVVVREPDPKLQLRVLRELSGVLQKKPDIQLMLDMVMEGIFRGIGMDRALLAVLTPDRKALKVKYALGEEQEQLKDAFQFDLHGPEGSLVKMALTTQRPLWPTASMRALSPLIKARLAPEFFLGPLAVKGKDIGLIYADRRPSGRGLDEDSFESFRHFIDQANLALTQLIRR